MIFACDGDLLRRRRWVIIVHIIAYYSCHNSIITPSSAAAAPSPSSRYCYYAWYRSTYLDTAWYLPTPLYSYLPFYSSDGRRRRTICVCCLRLSVYFRPSPSLQFREVRSSIRRVEGKIISSFLTVLDTKPIVCRRRRRSSVGFPVLTVGY